MSRAASRHFFWTENILQKEEPEGKYICALLSRDDQIVDAGEVRRYLTGGEEERRWEEGRLEVLFFSGLDHAMVFDTRERSRPVLDVVRRFVRLAE